MRLSEAQQERYARHLLLGGLGGEGQERLLGACVRIRGAGRAARWAARYLAASGIGTLILDDPSIAAECRDLSPDLHASTDLDRAPDLDIDLEDDSVITAKNTKIAKDLISEKNFAPFAVKTQAASILDSEALIGAMAAMRAIRKLSRP